MGLDERIEDLTGLLIALSIYLIIRWAQRKWPEPSSVGKKKKPEEPVEGAVEEPQPDPEAGN